MKIAMIGAGYVGLTTGACLAELGHVVSGVDVDADLRTRPGADGA
jgi:UDPglucose 6-dehydrogenase